MHVYLVFSISKDASNSKGGYNRKTQFKEKKLSFKDKSMPQIRQQKYTQRLKKCHSSNKQTVGVYLAFELYVETCFLIVTVNESCVLLLGSICYRQ